VELREHQQKALDRLQNGRILWGGVGSGKSMVAVAYYQKTQGERRAIVITTAKKRDSLDWEREFARIAVGKTANSTVQGVLSVDSWNNIHKYEDVKDAFFIFDEQRLVGSGGWVRSFHKIAKRNAWILLSATPGDNWMDYVPVFVANGFYKNRTEFKAKHVIYRPFSKFPAIDRYVDTGQLVRLRNRILVHMPYERHTKRRSVKVAVEFDQALMKRVMRDRWNPFEDRPIRSSAEYYSCMRRVANSDPSRVAKLEDILEKHPRVIVFYNFDYELEILRGLASSYCVVEWNGHKHQEIPDQNEWVYLVQYTAGAEGWECILTDATVFYSQTYSYKQWMQAHGRTDRLNTEYIDLWYYQFLSDSWIDKAVRRSLEGKKDFNESEMSV
jgi:superfamily II DNA or RNA helicase